MQKIRKNNGGKFLPQTDGQTEGRTDRRTDWRSWLHRTHRPSNREGPKLNQMIMFCNGYFIILDEDRSKDGISHNKWEERKNIYSEISLDIGKYRQISADIGRYRQISAEYRQISAEYQQNIGRYRQISANIGRYRLAIQVELNRSTLLGGASINPFRRPYLFH